MAFQNQRNILSGLAQGIQRAGEAVGSFFAQKAQQEHEQGVGAIASAEKARNEAMKALATGAVTPQERAALNQRIQNLEAIMQAPPGEARQMWAQMERTTPITSTVMQRGARTEEGQPQAAGFQGGLQQGQRPAQGGGVAQVPATRTTATPFSGIIADVLGRANLMANQPEAAGPERHPYMKTVDQVMDTLEDREVDIAERQAIADRLIAQAPPEVRDEVAAQVSIAGVSGPKPITGVDPAAYVQGITTTVMQGTPNSFADIDLPVDVRARKAAAVLSLAPNEAVREAMRESISTSASIPMDELTAAERARDVAIARTELVTGPQMLKAELAREQVGLEADELGIKETTTRIENLQLSMDDTRAAMQQRAETHEQNLRARDTTEEEVRQGMQTEALRIFNESGIIIDKKYEKSLVEAVPGISSVQELRELGQERFDRYEALSKLELRAEQLGVNLQAQSLTNEKLEGQLLTLDLAKNSFDQVTTAQEFLETAVNSGGMGLPHIDRLLMNVRASEAGQPLPFPNLAHVSEEYSEDQLLEARSIAEEVEVTDDLERAAANEAAFEQYVTSRSDAFDTLARTYDPETLDELFDPQSDSHDVRLDRMLTPGEKKAVRNRSILHAAIRNADDPLVAQGMESLQLLADSKYPMDQIQGAGRDAIVASLDQAGIDDPQIRQGYIDAITMGWHMKNVLDQDRLDETTQESVSEARLRLNTSLEATRDLMRDGGCFSEISIRTLTISEPEVSLAESQCQMYYQTAQTLQESLLLLSDTAQPEIGPPGEPPPPGGTTTPPGGSTTPPPGAGANTGEGGADGIPAPGAYTRAFSVWKTHNAPTLGDRAAKDRYMLREYNRLVATGADPKRVRDTLIEAFGPPASLETQIGIQQAPQ